MTWADTIVEALTLLALALFVGMGVAALRDKKIAKRARKSGGGGGPQQLPAGSPSRATSSTNFPPRWGSP